MLYDSRLVVKTKMTAVFKVSFEGFADDVGEGAVVFFGCKFGSCNERFWDTDMDGYEVGG
jgi:hypothetical protein